MENIKLNIESIFDFVSKKDFEEQVSRVREKNLDLHNKTNKGSDFLGWVDLPSSIKESEIVDIQATAQRLQSLVDVLVVIGIGGSYLGAKAVIDGLSNSFAYADAKKQVVYAGQNLSEDYLFELREFLKDRSYGLCVISKSGTTTEPALAFRLLKNDMEKKYGKQAAQERIVAVTDQSKGVLRKVADEEGYKAFPIPDDVGGRYSVLTAVGLLPIAFAGFNIRDIVKGAQDIEKLSQVDDFQKNICEQYALSRNLLYKKGFTIEVMANYQPKLCYFIERRKQLFGESEGKEHKGIFPAGVNFTTDLHSLGQYVQDGQRNLFETVLSIKEPNSVLTIPKYEVDFDGLNFLADRRVNEINKMAELGTTIAHIDGGVPLIKLEIPKLNEYYIGQLIYFFEKSCGISGYLLDVNPFDQPGVENYKKNMFALLGKPGFEKEQKILNDRCQNFL